MFWKIAKFILRQREFSVLDKPDLWGSPEGWADGQVSWRQKFWPKADDFHSRWKFQKQAIRFDSPVHKINNPHSPIRLVSIVAVPARLKAGVNVWDLYTREVERHKLRALASTHCPPWLTTRRALRPRVPYFLTRLAITVGDDHSSAVQNFHYVYHFHRRNTNNNRSFSQYPL